MLSFWQSKNDVGTDVLGDHHRLMFISSWKEMEHRDASVTVRRRVQHSQVSLQVSSIRSNGNPPPIHPRCQ
jgi:hypothetical protein